MRKRLLILGAFAMFMASGSVVAGAHECTYDGPTNESGNQVECHETPVVPNWRDGNYIPLFDLADRDEPEQRKAAQRWREECSSYDAEGNYQSRQQCAWAYGGTSVIANRGDTNRSPNEFHVGYAASHCFLFEAAHQCEDHDKRRGEGVHDAHGGAIYADVCLTPNPESRHCDDGMSDTQAGVTIMDHNPCGTIVPIVACTDEYHIVRPLDQEYTQEQIDDTAPYIMRIIANPRLYLCGYPQYGSNPICPASNTGDPGVPDARELVSAVPAGEALQRLASRAAAGDLSAARAYVTIAAAGVTGLEASPAGSGARSAAAWLGVLGLLGMAVVARARRLAVSR